MKVKSIRPISLQDMENFQVLEERDVVKRQLRAPLLTAFDIYKSNVAYGVKVETKEEHEEILAWYQALLDLEESALIHIPSAVVGYVRG